MQEMKCRIILASPCLVRWLLPHSIDLSETIRRNLVKGQVRFPHHSLETCTSKHRHKTAMKQQELISLRSVIANHKDNYCGANRTAVFLHRPTALEKVFVEYKRSTTGLLYPI